MKRLLSAVGILTLIVLGVATGILFSRGPWRDASGCDSNWEGELGPTVDERSVFVLARDPAVGQNGTRDQPLLHGLSAVCYATT